MELSLYGLITTLTIAVAVFLSLGFSGP
jgi:hypothetical protein